jgi:hypothetical protein
MVLWNCGFRVTLLTQHHLNFSLTVLKRACRGLHLKKWPGRELRRTAKHNDFKLTEDINGTLEASVVEIVKS